MFFWKALALAVSAASFATAAVTGSSHTEIKLFDGTVAGAEDGTSYYFNSTRTTDKCDKLSVEDLESSLVQFDPLFPRLYSNGPYREGQTGLSVGSLYLDTDSGVKGFYLTYDYITPNTTATWVDAGADIANVWVAIREDMAEQWARGSTFQFGYYSINKIMDGVSNYAGELTMKIQTPTFVKLCDTSCGGHCNPNICDC